jgi:hypothetical protein
VAKNRTRSFETFEYFYKGHDFDVTATPIKELPPHGWTWAAKVGGIIAAGGEFYGHTAEEAAEKARKAEEARIDGRAGK